MTYTQVMAPPPTPHGTPRPPGSPEPRWLSPEQQRAWRALAGVLLRLPPALESALQRDAGLSHFEYLVLSALSEAPGATLRLSQLAALTNSSLSRLSHVVTRLEGRGWIHRVTCPRDARATNAILTEAGHATVVAAAPGHVEAVRSLVIDALDPEDLPRLEAIAGRILERVDPARHCPGTPEPTEQSTDSGNSEPPA